MMSRPRPGRKSSEPPVTVRENARGTAVSLKGSERETAVSERRSSPGSASCPSPPARTTLVGAEGHLTPLPHSHLRSAGGKTWTSFQFPCQGSPVFPVAFSLAWRVFILYFNSFILNLSRLFDLRADPLVLPLPQPSIDRIPASHHISQVGHILFDGSCLGLSFHPLIPPQKITMVVRGANVVSGV